MAGETRALIRALQDAINETLDALSGLSDEQLAAACSHPCGHGPGKTASIWHLLANNIDHERMHAGQVLSLRHDLRVMQTQPARLLGEWLRERAALIGALVGLPDDALDRRPKPEEWSIREVVEHTLYWERDSLAAGLRDLAGGERWCADPELEYGSPVPRPKPVQ
jgi:uncharacterized damage-inducible protein DinB